MILALVMIAHSFCVTDSNTNFSTYFTFLLHDTSNLILNQSNLMMTDYWITAGYATLGFCPVLTVVIYNSLHCYFYPTSKDPHFHRE